MIRRAALLLLACAVTTAQPSSVSTQRTAFLVRCIEEANGSRKTLYESKIEGPPGTDFTVVMRDPRYEMEASFLNEIIDGRELDIRVKLESRRRYGVSRNRLPLWEEDRQEHRLALAFGDQIELLPFGAPGSSGLLKIEIVPERGRESVYLPNGELRPTTINLGAHDLGGAIEVTASRTPHWFDAEVTLLENGRPSGKGRATLFYGAPGRISMTTSAGPLADLRITAESFPYLDRWTAAAVKIEREGATSGGVVFFDRPTSLEIDPPARSKSRWTLQIALRPTSRPNRNRHPEARTPHPAFGHPLPASRGEGQILLSPRVRGEGARNADEGSAFFHTL